MTSGPPRLQLTLDAGVPRPPSPSAIVPSMTRPTCPPIQHPGGGWGVADSLSGCHCPARTLPFDGHTCWQKRKGAQEEEGTPLGIFLGGGGGGEKTRCAGHLWSMSVICIGRKGVECGGGGEGVLTAPSYSSLSNCSPNPLFVEPHFTKAQSANWCGYPFAPKETLFPFQQGFRHKEHLEWGGGGGGWGGGAACKNVLTHLSLPFLVSCAPQLSVKVAIVEGLFSSNRPKHQSTCLCPLPPFPGWSLCQRVFTSPLFTL